MHELRVISWNVTRRCNLSCAHCYLPAITTAGRDTAVRPPELPTGEAVRLIDQIARVNSGAMLILSGGEPLLREDLFELSAFAARRGMTVVLGSNGLLIDDSAVSRMKQDGVSGISISLDSLDPAIHDAARSCTGAWEKAVSAIRRCSAGGLSVQVNTVVTARNANSFPALAEFSRGLGAKVWSPFFLVCTGRGEELTDLSPPQYERALLEIVTLQKKHAGIMVRTRSAPTIRRVLQERDPESVLLMMDSGRCLAGLSYCRITPEGDVTPCPYLPVPAGNVREKEFEDIWAHADLFGALRRPALKGKCSVCGFRLLCGGCRARAYSMHRDLFAEDPWCMHVPAGGDLIQAPVTDSGSDAGPDDARKPVWTPDAEERLGRVPTFIRPMVRRAVEQYAVERRCREITPAIMSEVRKKAGMGGMGGHR